jgi:hypothetical protein
MDAPTIKGKKRLLGTYRFMLFKIFLSRDRLLINITNVVKLTYYLVNLSYLFMTLIECKNARSMKSCRGFSTLWGL